MPVQMHAGAASRAHLSSEQDTAFDAMSAFLRSPHRQTFVLHGLAGTGKTTLLAALARAHPDAILCTLTGKAASVLQRKTGLPACTIHSAFYRLRKVTRDGGKRTLHWDSAHETGQLQGGLILLDECSMVDRIMARDLLATGAKIIACGDPGQLPPVRGVQHFDSPDFTLRTVHRQAWDSPIIRQAHAVREGKSYQADGDAFIVSAEADDAAVRDAGAILCWTNRMRQHANGEARKVRGLWMKEPQVGEPVMCLRNNPDHGIYNGAVYTLAAPFIPGTPNIRLDLDGDIVTIQSAAFEGLERAKGLLDDDVTPFTFGYAMTVHKAQGSEFSSLILLDDYRAPQDRDKWLYTGITRAAERILVVRA